MVDIEEFLYVVCKMRGDEEGCVAADRGVRIFLLTDNNSDVEPHLSPPNYDGILSVMAWGTRIP